MKKFLTKKCLKTNQIVPKKKKSCNKTQKNQSWEKTKKIKLSKIEKLKFWQKY